MQYVANHIDNLKYNGTKNMFIQIIFTICSKNGLDS